jgi:DNA-binding LytR/AlgR family response regulator
MNLSSTEKALSKQLSNNAKQFVRIGRRFIVNMKFINLIDIPKQRLLLSDSSLFTFSLPVSKEALKIVKELVLKSKL